ncbi:MAG: hypothetical protein P0111_10450 [Nitrospira sp.]|nr:hypothetical protein [Nitrospira sp.]
MLSQRTRWFAVLSLVGWLLCTMDSPAVAGSSAVDPCKVVTTAEVEQTIGKLKGTPKADKEGDAAWCNYEFTNGKDAMEVWVFPADGLERAKRKAKQTVAVKGLGDEAFLTRGMFGLDYVDLYIKKGNTTVKLALKETAGDEEKLKMLGQKAVGRF